MIQLQLLESAKRSGHGHLLELPQVDARLVPRRNRPCREHDREADAAASKPPRRQEQSGSTSSLSRRHCLASKRECRSLYVLRRCEDHTWQLSRFSSAVPDGLGSIACRGDARDSELPEAQSCVSCVDGLYNFVRPHMALKFGLEVRTPAMQAGLSTRRLTFREIFSSTCIFWRCEMSLSCSSTPPCWSMWTIRVFLWRRSNTGWRKHRSVSRPSRRRVPRFFYRYDEAPLLIVNSSVSISPDDRSHLDLLVSRIGGMRRRREFFSILASSRDAFEAGSTSLMQTSSLRDFGGAKNQ